MNWMVEQKSTEMTIKYRCDICNNYAAIRMWWTSEHGIPASIHGKNQIVTNELCRGICMKNEFTNCLCAR